MEKGGYAPARELGTPGALVLNGVLDVPVAHVRDTPIASEPARRAVPLDGLVHTEVECIADHYGGRNRLRRVREDVVRRVWCVARALQWGPIST